MPLLSTINYSTPGDFTFDADDIEVITAAKIKLQSASQQFTEDFTDDTGFTYDNTKAEFVGGVLRTKPLTVANELFAATIIDSLNADRFTGSGTGTVSGTVPRTLVSGEQYIDITDTTSGNNIEYPAANADFGETGTIRFKYIPDYNTAPSANRFLFNLIGAAGANNITMFHQATQNIQMRINNASGTLLVAKDYALIALAQGQEYEFELNFDFTTGATRFFIDGVQQGTTLATSFSRGAITNFQIGASTGASEAYFRDVQVFDNVQHTSNFIGEVPRVLNRYFGSQIILPEFAHTALGQVTSYTSLAATEIGTEARYTVQLNQLGTYVYWNGAAWVASDGTYAQANTKEDFTTNAGSLTVGAGIYSQVRIHFTDTRTLTSVDDLILDNVGNTDYLTTNPHIIVNSGFVSDAIFSFTESVITPGSDAVQYTLDVSGQEKYWTGAAWADSNSTYAQSNSAADINTNAAALDISTGQTIKVKAFLHSADGTTTPTLTSVAVAYSFSAPSITTPLECVVFAYVRTILGEPHATAIKLIVTNEATFYYGNIVVVPPNVQTIEANLEGNVDVSLIETATPVTKYKFQIQYVDFEGTPRVVLLGNATVPNQTTVNLATLTFS